MPNYEEVERLHRQLIPGQIHTPFQWIFENDADKSTITSANLKPIDCGKIAYKKDNKGIYILLNNDPVQWGYLNDVSSISGNFNNFITRDELGTAAFIDTGTSNGNIPIIGSNNKLSANIIPEISVSNVTGLGSAALHDVVVMSGEEVSSGDVVVLNTNKKIPTSLMDISELGTKVIEGLGTAAYKNIGTSTGQVPVSENVPILDTSNHIPNKYYGFMTSDKISNAYLSIFDNSTSRINKNLLPSDVVYTGNIIINEKIKEELLPCLELKGSEYKLSNSYLNIDPNDGNAVVLYNNLYDVLDTNGFAIVDKELTANGSVTITPTGIGDDYDLRSANFSIKIKENNKYYVNIEALNNIWIEFSGTSNQKFIIHNDNSENKVVYINISF